MEDYESKDGRDITHTEGMKDQWAKEENRREVKTVQPLPVAAMAGNKRKCECKAITQTE